MCLSGIDVPKLSVKNVSLEKPNENTKTTTSTGQKNANCE